MTRRDYEDWLASRPSGAGGNSLESLQSYVLTLWLAERAVERGADRDPVFLAGRKQIEERLLVASMRRQEEALAVVTEEDLDRLQVEFPDAFKKPRRVRARNLFKRVPQGATASVREAARTQISTLRQRVLEGGDFAELASEYSDSESALRGGLMGMVRPGALPERAERLIFDLDEGEISEVVESPDGFMLFYCEEVFPAEEPAVDVVRANFTANLRKQRMKERWSSVESRSFGGAELGYFPERAEEEGAVLVAGPHPPIDTHDLAADLRSTPVRSGGELRPEALRIRLEFLAQTRLLAQEARRRGIEPAPERRRTLRFRRVEDLAVGELARRVAERFEEPTEADFRRWYEEHGESLKRKPELALSVIRLDFDEADRAGFRATADLARELSATLLASPERFGELAREHSRGPAADRGGDLGWVTRLRVFNLGGNLARAVESLEIDEVSSPVREGDSYWVVRLRDFRPERAMTYEEAQPIVVQRVGQELTDELRGRIESELIASLEVEAAQRPPE